MKFVIYKDKKKEFRWKLMTTNGNIIANSGEGYKAKRNLKNAILRVCESATAQVIDRTARKKPND